MLGLTITSWKFRFKLGVLVDGIKRHFIELWLSLLTFRVTLQCSRSLIFGIEQKRSQQGTAEPTTKDSTTHPLAQEMIKGYISCNVHGGLTLSR